MLARDKRRVMLVVNSDVPVSQQAADLYCDMRGIDRSRQWRWPMGNSIYWNQPEDGFAWVPFVSAMAAAAKAMTASCVLFSAATPMYYRGNQGSGVALPSIPAQMFMALRMADPSTAGYQFAAESAPTLHGRMFAWRANGGSFGDGDHYLRSLAWHRMARHVGLPCGRIGIPSYDMTTLDTERLEDVRRVVSDAIANEKSAERHMHLPHVFGVSTRTTGSAYARDEFVARGFRQDMLRWFMPSVYNPLATPPDEYRLQESYSDIYNGRVQRPIPFFALAGGALTNPWGRVLMGGYLRGIVSIQMFSEPSGEGWNFWYEVETSESHNLNTSSRTVITGVSFPQLDEQNFETSAPAYYSAGELLGLMRPSVILSPTRWRGPKTFVLGNNPPGQDLTAYGDVALSSATVRQYERAVEFSGVYDKSFLPMRGAWVYENTSFCHQVGQDMLHKGACLYVGSIIEPWGSQLNTTGFCRVMLEGMTAAEAVFLTGCSRIHAAVGDPLYAPYKMSARSVASGLTTLADGSGGFSSYGGPLSDFGGDNPFNCDWP